MAKVTIEIEDKDLGKVKTVVTPSFETLMKKINSGEGLSAAEGYAFTAINAIREASKNQDPLKIWVPRIGR